MLNLMFIVSAFLLFLQPVSCCCYCKPPIARLSYHQSKHYDIEEESYVIIPNTWIQPTIITCSMRLPSFADFMSANGDAIFRKVSADLALLMSSKCYMSESEYWIQGQGIAARPFTEYERELEGLERAISKAISNSDSVVTKIRDRLWTLLFRRRKKPKRSEIKKFHAETIEIIRGILPDSTGTRGLEHHLKEHIVGFFLPPVRIWHEADPDSCLPTKILGAMDYSVASITDYITSLATIHTIIQREIDQEERFRGPYGLGQDVVLCLVNYHAKRNYRRDLQKLTLQSFSCTTDAALQPIELKLIRMSKAKKERFRKRGDTDCMVRVLIRQRNGNLVFSTGVSIPWKNAGRFLYPSVLLLKKEFEEHLRDIGFLPSLNYYPVSRRSDNMIIPSNGQGNSMLLSKLPLDVLKLIITVVDRTRYVKEVALVCKAFYLIYDPVPSADIGRVKEFVLDVSIPRSRLLQFIVASVATFGLRNDINDGVAVDTAAGILAMILCHIITPTDPTMILIGKLRDRLLLPSYLKEWTPNIDVDMITRIGDLLFILVRKKEQWMLRQSRYAPLYSSPDS